MAVVNGETSSKAAVAFSQLSITKQVGLLIGLAASIAIGVSVVFWGMEPSYRPISTNMNSLEASQVIDVLQRSGIEYKIDPQHGVIMVAAKDIHNARLKLAAEGFPRTAGTGTDFFTKKSAFGDSAFMQAARYKHALAAELAQTISHFKNIRSARVHLAIPKQTSFLRRRKPASASVFVNLYQGERLTPTEVASIVHLIASSIDNLSSDDVTVVDGQGNLLTEGGGGDHMAAADRAFMYRSQVENNYAHKIEDLLSPIIGAGRVRARVSVDLDFTQQEMTQESYDPKKSVIRSEQLFEVNEGKAKSVGGATGALANSPLAAATLQDPNKDAGTHKTAAKQTTMGQKQSTKNYELDRTISHTRKQAGVIKRLNIAVLVDDKKIVDPKTGKVTYKKLDKPELEQLTQLVKTAVGFNEQRGDQVQVLNSSFTKPEPIEDMPEEAFYQQVWFWDLLKQSGSGLLIILLVFGVLRPIMKNLAKSTNQLPAATGADAADVASDSAVRGASATAIASAGTGTANGRVPTELLSYEDRMNVVKQMASNEPKRVASVVKTWVDCS